MNLITFSALIAFTSELVHTEQLKNIKKKLLKVTDYYGFLDALNIPYYRPENEGMNFHIRFKDTFSRDNKFEFSHAKLYAGANIF
uniref:Uncharacterized protein n=1 Tax=Parascaris equorum TaxID=6256 RepID=A0A914S9S8_PAREQ